MFEKFTEKAINVVTQAQKEAKEMQNSLIQPEHIFLAIIKEARGISLKIFKMYNIDYNKFHEATEEKLRFEKTANPKSNPQFSESSKNLLKLAMELATRSNNELVLYEHIFLAALENKNSYIGRILEKFKFNTAQAEDLLKRLVQKKIKKLEHPEKFELTAEEEKYRTAERLFDGDTASKIFDKAVSKLHASKYEILGTDQIISAILEDKDSDLSKILTENGVTSEEFDRKIEETSSRQAEFEGHQIVFTPNAFIIMNNALQIAKELGSSEVTPEHVILGMLKVKKGVAYDIFKSMKVDDSKLKEAILKPIEHSMSESLTIMKLAKQEAHRLGKNVVGTEMFLVGILGESSNIAARVLTELEITIKDVRLTIENFVGLGNDYTEGEITFTNNAKKILELAWTAAKKENKKRIEAYHILDAITMVPDSVAMKTLEHLGVDAVEIKQGIINELNKAQC